MRDQFLSRLSVVLLAAPLAAQTMTYLAPSGTQTVEGNSNNTIPWWSGSATYQQVHDSVDLALVFPSAVAIIKGISFRKEGGTSAALATRTVDAQVTMGVTPVIAAAASTVFAANLGPAPLVVLPYMNISLPAQTGTALPNPPGWSFPFLIPFPYVVSIGNLCWELRLKNSSSSAIAPCDAVSGTASTPMAIINPLLGLGCIATGQTSRSTIGIRSLNLTTGLYINQLDRGPSLVAAALVMGAQQQTLTLPGLCGSLETIPLVSFSGTTNASGSWNNQLTFGSLVGYPTATIYAQFAFIDPGLPYGFGLSDCSPITLPPPGSVGGMARIYASPFNSGQGNEIATTGSRETSPYGLVTGFDT